MLPTLVLSLSALGIIESYHIYVSCERQFYSAEFENYVLCLSSIGAPPPLFLTISIPRHAESNKRLCRILRWNLVETAASQNRHSMLQ